ncbi:MAG TPA: hypothetical protein VES62_07325 [Thermoleophilaceae bacterium]|nr:hypothetical protein [Thermoleophilaceae bacterium]
MLLGATVGLVLAALLATASGAADGRPRSGDELYAMVVDAAQRGDQRAAQELAALDAYMAQRGLRPADLGVPTLDPARAETYQGLVRLAVEDAAPWRMTILNSTSFANADDVAAYIAIRSATLEAFASNESQRQVEAVISPSGPTSTAAFLDVLSCPCEGVSLIVDVFGPEGWMMAAGRELVGRDVRLAASLIETEILDQAAFSLDNFPGVTRADLRAEVRMVRVKMTAQSAYATSVRDEVLLVDLLTDIADAYAGRAAVVEVVGAPDLREAYQRLVLGDPADPVWPARN